MLRGGSFNNEASNARCARRNRNQPDNLNTNIGFRVVAAHVFRTSKTACQKYAASLITDSASRQGKRRALFLSDLSPNPSPTRRGGKADIYKIAPPPRSVLAVGHPASRILF
ncbi:MAG: hypothetical protein DCC52_02545 [Chloroflexi bacterium]|nr:MAG: hypothetical protein DCC52_02545 [Chloroflexota bacterium]